MHDFRSSFLNLAEKLFRQRGFWNHLRRKAENDGDEGASSAYAKVVADIDYVIGKAMDSVPPEAESEIHELVRQRQEERYARRQNRFEPMLIET